MGADDGMSAGLIGALIGLAVAIVYMFLLRLLASRVELAETKRVLNVTGISQLVLLPAAGWLIGNFVFGE
jgi:nucleoside recognition membrane protein YjiH